MRIVIDLQGCQTSSRFRGIGRYSLALARAIAANPNGHEIWLVLNAALAESLDPIRQAFTGLIPEQRIRIFDIPAPVAEINSNNAWRARAAELLREDFIQQLQPDVVLVSSLFEGYLDDASVSVGSIASSVKTAVILYDLIPLLNPDTYLSAPAMAQYYQRKIHSLRNANLLLAISGHSRQEAISTLGTAPETVVTISTAAGDAFQPAPSPDLGQLHQRLGITRPVVLYAPGGFDPRKNTDSLITAYSMLPPALREAHQLVIASKVGDHMRRHLERLAKQAGLAPQELVLTGYLSENELIALYRTARLFVFPSKHEGFGLPALEAMACGASVIGSNCTSIPEVIGLSDALFDPHSPPAIMEKMTQVLGDEAFRQRLREHGLNQAQQFSWDKSARRALQALETLAQRPPPAPNPDTQTLVKAIASIPPPPATEGSLLDTANCINFNAGRGSAPRQLLVDISHLVERDAKSGIQRVIRSILRELLHNPPTCEVRPVYFDGKQYRYANTFTSGFYPASPYKGLADDIVDFYQDDIYLDLDLNIQLSPQVHKLHQWMRQRGGGVHFIVYDILLLQHPEWWPKGTDTAFRTWLDNIANIASSLLCISASVAEEVRCWLAEHPPARETGPAIHSFHLGADIENSIPTRGMPENAAQVLAQLGNTHSFLMVGTIEPRKGHAQTLAAFEQLWQQQQDVTLAIVGRHGWLVDPLVHTLRHHPEQGRRLFWLESISDEYLQQVYAACACLIAASEGEGFGLPLIEAAQHHTPIIARDIPVFREVAGEHALYFSGTEPDAISTAVTTWLARDAAGQTCHSEGMPWLTWQESTQQLLRHIL